MSSLSEIKFRNLDLQFINAVKIKTDNLLSEFKLLGTHQRIPQNYLPIEYSQVESSCGTYVDINFHRPHNYFNFKIICSGALIEHDQVSLVYYEPKSPNVVRDFIKRKKIVFIGCARNCDSSLQKSIEVMSKLGDNFLEYKLIVAGNNSEDNTLHLLNDLKKSYPLDFYSFGDLDSSMSLRTQRLSYCRNFLLDKAKLLNYDYICVADLDGVFNESLELESFFSSWAFEECWDGCFPINDGIYYDLWALRHSELIPEDFSIRMNRAVYSLSEPNIADIYLKPLQNINFNLLKGWLEVDSAFGGMGIYKSKSLTHVRYWGVDNENEICEHVILHQKMKTLHSAKLYINPQFMIKGMSYK